MYKVGEKKKRFIPYGIFGLNNGGMFLSINNNSEPTKAHVKLYRIKSLTNLFSLDAYT